MKMGLAGIGSVPYVNENSENVFRVQIDRHKALSCC